MMKSLSVRLLAAGALLLIAAPIVANPIPVPLYSWEDGSTVLGLYGAGDPPIICTNVTAPDPVNWGTHSLRLEDNCPSGTPQAYIAFIWDLQDGDYVMAGFWRYDTTPEGAPSVRLWAHWNDELPGNPDGYSGSAGGNDDYGLGEGWDYTYWEWTVTDGHSGMVIEARTYSNPGDTVWIDDVEVLAPMHAKIMFPDLIIPTETLTWGGVKSLYRD
jgi:hypothetical protein